MRPTSLRARSTIITFSARFFSDAASHAARSSSSSRHRPRAAVPFIGFVVIRPPRILKNSSGESDSTRQRPRSRYAEYGARCVLASWR